MSRQEIKFRAKAQLGNNIFGSKWLMALLIVLIAQALSYAVNAIPGIGTVISLLIAGPIMYGCRYVFLMQARDGKEMVIEDLFEGFKADFSQLFLLNLLQTLFIALWTCLLIVPGIVKAYAYSMSYYIKVDHPEYGWKECIDESRYIMNGHKAELFVLDLSFLGWIIVGALCLGIGTLWVIPYMEAAHAQFYESIRSHRSAIPDQFDLNKDLPVY